MLGVTAGGGGRAPVPPPPPPAESAPEYCHTANKFGKSHWLLRRVYDCSQYY